MSLVGFVSLLETPHGIDQRWNPRCPKEMSLQWKPCVWWGFFLPFLAYTLTQSNSKLNPPETWPSLPLHAQNLNQPIHIQGSTVLVGFRGRVRQGKQASTLDLQILQATTTIITIFLEPPRRLRLLYFWRSTPPPPPKKKKQGPLPPSIQGSKGRVIWGSRLKFYPKFNQTFQVPKIEGQGCRFGPESSRQTLVSPIFGFGLVPSVPLFRKMKSATLRYSHI